MVREASTEGPDERLARLCHDLRQYITASQNLAEMPDDLGQEPAQRFRLIAQQLGLANELINAELRSFRQQTRQIDLVDLVDECVQTVRLTRDVPISVKAPQNTTAYGDPVRIRRAVTNVVDNAARAAEGAVDVTIDAEDGMSWVQVCDDGEGFGRLAAGLGQGLSIVQDAVRSNDGRLEILSGPGPGTTVRLLWPQHANR